jgi:hypothetical protein
MDILSHPKTPAEQKAVVTLTPALNIHHTLASFNCQTMSHDFSSIIFLFDGDLFSLLLKA